MGLVDGKRFLITGVLTDASLAFAVAQLAQEQGAEVVLTGAGRGLSLTKRTARKLAQPADVLELDVTVPEQLSAVRTELERRWGGLDGVLHAIAFAPPSCLGGDFLDAPWEDVSVALNVSAYSLKALAAEMAPLMAHDAADGEAEGTADGEAAGAADGGGNGDDNGDRKEGGSVVGLTFDATVAWPAYDWMGVAKAAFESTARYLARELGPRNIRVNLISAGPIRTMAAKSIPGFAAFEDAWQQRSPLGWSLTDHAAVARSTLALMSDWFDATTGEIIHVDGGYHAVGA